MAKIYVGTYAKYASGSIAGAWLDLEDYGNEAAFLRACRELHQDEADPELMFQDFEDFPAEYYSEAGIDPQVFDWLNLSADEREIVEAYLDGVDRSGSIQDALDAYAGRYDTKEDWAEQYLADTGLLDSIPDNLRIYFDVSRWLRDVELEGSIQFTIHNGDYFAFNS